MDRKSQFNIQNLSIVIGLAGAIFLIIVAIAWLLGQFPDSSSEQITEPNQYTRAEWAQELPQESDSIEKIAAAFPYRGDNFTVFAQENNTTNTTEYIVEYAPYLTKDDIRPKLEGLFRSYDISTGKIIWQDGVNTTESFEYNYPAD